MKPETIAAKATVGIKHLFTQRTGKSQWHRELIRILEANNAIKSDWVDGKFSYTKYVLDGKSYLFVERHKGGNTRESDSEQIKRHNQELSNT